MNPTECDYCTSAATHRFLDREASWAGLLATGCQAHADEERAAGGRVVTLAEYAATR